MKNLPPRDRKNIIWCLPPEKKCRITRDNPHKQRSDPHATLGRETIEFISLRIPHDCSPSSLPGHETQSPMCVLPKKPGRLRHLDKPIINSSTALAQGHGGRPRTPRPLRNIPDRWPGSLKKRWMLLNTRLAFGFSSNAAWTPGSPSRLFSKPKN